MGRGRLHPSENWLMFPLVVSRVDGRTGKTAPCVRKLFLEETTPHAAFLVRTDSLAVGQGHAGKDIELRGDRGGARPKTALGRGGSSGAAQKDPRGISPSSETRARLSTADSANVLSSNPLAKTPN